MNLDRFLHDILFEMKQKGITQKEVAEAVGLSRMTVSNILSGKKGTIDSIKKIIKYVEEKEK